MRAYFPSLTNTLKSLAVYLGTPKWAPKKSDSSDAQADVSEQLPSDNKSESSEVDEDLRPPRWMYRGHYRSRFPPNF